MKRRSKEEAELKGNHKRECAERDAAILDTVLSNESKSQRLVCISVEKESIWGWFR